MSPPMSMTLFYAPGACSLASHIVLEETGEAYEAVRLDLAAGEQTRPEFLAINPRGKVPALATEQGVLTESPAILAYLADRRPELELLPRDPFQRAQAASTMAWLSSTVHPCFGRIWRGAAITDDKDAWSGLRAKAKG